MSIGKVPRTGKSARADVRPTARKALLQLLEPLTGFVMDSGLGIQEFGALVRQAAVHSIAAHQLQIAKRVNISGIAAATGISRADVSKILKAKANGQEKVVDRHQQSTNKILAAWNQDPKFTTPNGHPADLKIYGRGATFEALVKSHGRGIPTRAMLDELLRTGAIELRSAQKVRLKTALAVDRGLTPQVVKAFGDRAAELMATLLQNMRHPEAPMFVANVSGSTNSPGEIPLFRKELSTKGADFLTEMQDVLVRHNNSKIKSDVDDLVNKLSVTIYYHQANPSHHVTRASIGRRNFRRESS